MSGGYCSNHARQPPASASQSDSSGPRRFPEDQSLVFGSGIVFGTAPQPCRPTLLSKVMRRVGCEMKNNPIPDDIDPRLSPYPECLWPDVEAELARRSRDVPETKKNCRKCDPHERSGQQQFQWSDPIDTDSVVKRPPTSKPTQSRDCRRNR